jgi:hypothetical protein
MKTKKAGNKIEQKKGTERGRVVKRKGGKGRGYKEEGRQRKSRKAGNMKDGREEGRSKSDRTVKKKP